MKCRHILQRNCSQTLDTTDYPIYSDNQQSDVIQTPRTTAKLPLSSTDLEERELANIQTAMTQSYPYIQSNRVPQLLQFPYDSNQFQQVHGVGNYGRYTTREQGITEDAGMTYYEDRVTNPHFSFKHQLEIAEHNFNGPFLTQELERLHMVYGTENLIDRNYFLQRELST